MSHFNVMPRWCFGAKYMNMFMFLAIPLGVLLLCLPAFSQSNSRILGTVTDQSGGVVAGATVFVIDMERGIPRSVTTDDAGVYNAPNLNPSTYMVRVEAKGFKKLERQNIVLEVGKEIRVDVTVQPGEQTQTVTVTEEVPLVETTNATLGGTISNADVNDMPLNGRLYQNLMSLRPGIVTQPGGSPWTQSTNNSRPDETVWMLDGVINLGFYDHLALAGHTSPFTDGATIMPIDAIQEFNMEENPKAEYGWMPGAVLNVAVKSGTNTLHGTAYAFGRDNALDARNAFNQGPIAGTCDLNPGIPAVCDKHPAQLEQFGATVGGPIKKDKLFFFGGYEGLRSFVSNAFGEQLPSAGSGGGPAFSMPDAITALQNAGDTTLCTTAGVFNCLSPQSLAIFGCTGTPATVGSYTCTGAGGNGAYGIQNAPGPNSNSYVSFFPNRNTSDNGVGKLEYRVNDQNLLTSMVFIGHYTSLGEDHAIVNSNWENDAPVETKTFTEAWIYTPASSVVNDLRFSYNRWSTAILPEDANLFANGTSYPINTGITSTGGFPEVFLSGNFGSAGGEVLGSWRGRPVENGPNPYYDVQDSVSYLRGKHTFKFGGEYAHIEADADVHDTRGRINFANLEDLFSGDVTSGSHLVGNPAVKLQMRSTAVFAQDDWRIVPKLIVNLGLRYSYVSPFKEDNGGIGNFDPQSPTGLVQQGQPGVNTLYSPDRLNFAPHLGFAWDVTGRGTTVLRGGGSMAYGLIQPAAFFQNPGPSGAHDHNTSLAADPTGFACAIGPGCPSGTFGGSITAGVVSIPGSSLLWNGPADLPGGAGIFPATAGVVPTCSAVSPCDLFAVDPNLKNSYVENWSLGITHAFNNNLSWEVGYVGNHGLRGTNIRDINAYEVVNGFTTTTQPYAAQFPDFDTINQVSNDAKSHYNSLQTTLTERVTHGLSFTAGYTYGHGLDNGSLSRFGAEPQNQYNPVAGEYASSDLDVRHRFTFSGTYEIPGKKGFGQLLEGWKINTVVTLQSGLPWLITDTGNDFTADSPHGGEETDRWNFTGNPANFTIGNGTSSLPYCTGENLPTLTSVGASCSQTSGISGIVTPFSNAQSAAMFQQCITADAPFVTAGPNTAGTGVPGSSNLGLGGCYVSGNAVMTPPAQNTFGDMGRNIFRDWGFKDWDLSVFKTFSFKERFSAQFRVEMFNVLNHPIISNPYGAANGWGGGDDPSSPGSFGCGCATPDVAAGNALVGSGSSRVMQLGFKLSF
jgi:hypothetical protein